MPTAERAELVVDLKLRDQLSGPVAVAKTQLGELEATARKAGSSFGGLGSSIAGLAKVSAGAFAAFKAFDFFADSLKAAAEEETGIRQLTASLKANVEGFTGNTAAIEKTIKAREAFAFSDDELRASLSALVGATHDVNKAFDLQALAMDLARFENVSLADASDQLIRVQAGSLRSLKALGIELDAGTTATEAFGRIQQVVAGQNEAFGSTSAAAFKRAEVAVHDLQEVIGTPLLSALSAVAEAAANAAKALGDFGKDAGDLIDRAERLGQTVVGTGSSFGLLGDAVNAVTGAFTASKRDYENLIAGSQRVSAASADADAKFIALSESAFAVAKASTDAADAARNVAQGIGGVEGPAVQATGAIDQLKTALDLLPTTINIGINVRTTLSTGLGATGGSGAPEPTNVQDTGNITDALAQSAKDKADKAAAAAQRAADKAASDAAAAAKQRANDLAAAYRDTVSNAFDAAKRRGDYLFDALHDRHIKAIKDAETLAQKQHDAALQQISDALKAAQAKDAAPVTAAEKALRDRQQAESRRDLVEAAQRAQQAVNENRDPAQAADLARALRAAKEALENFDAQSVIDRLKVVQGGLDAAAQGTADTATKQADADLAKAKVQAQKDADKATVDDQKQKQRFEQALAQLKDRDLKANKTPAELAADIAALEKRFGITTDAQGRHHIDDPLVTAIKTIKIPAPHITNIFRPNLTIRINGRDFQAAIVGSSSPSATSGVRSGQAGRG